MIFFDKKADHNAFMIVNGLIINGGFEGSAPGRIEGLIKGDVKINGKVIISESGIVEGSVKCYDLILDGSVYGDVIAHNSISVGKTGSVYGNVSSNSINIHPKSKVKGSINQLRNDGALDQKLKKESQKEINLKDPLVSKETFW